MTVSSQQMTQGATAGSTSQSTSVTSEWTRRSQSMINQAVNRGTGMLADRVEHYATIAREVGDILRERGEPQAADAASMIAERTQGAARYLRNTDGTEIWSDVQDFARGRMWLVIGVGLISGLALARAVRTAADYGGSSDEYREQYSQREGRYRNSPYSEQYSQ